MQLILLDERQRLMRSQLILHKGVKAVIIPILFENHFHDFVFLVLRVSRDLHRLNPGTDDDQNTQ